MHDVDPRQYTTVIREMIRHENDVTNHRLMWLLLVQGLIANAAVTARLPTGEIAPAFPAVGILVTVSMFALLYKSYQARGYLLFLGSLAKKGSLQENDLPLSGWPRKRIRGWWKHDWLCPWLGQASDLVEPYFFLPSLLVLAWMLVLLRPLLNLGVGTLLAVTAFVMAGMLTLFCVLWVWWHRKGEE